MDNDSNLQLVTLERKHRKQFADFAAAFINEQPPNLVKKGMVDFDAYIDWLKDLAAGKNLPADWVPSSTYWLIADGPVLGYVNIRHRLNDYFMTYGGHIGCTINPDYRRRGYSKLMCMLSLEKAKALGIDPVLITCDQRNIASIKSIEANGGVLEDQRYEEATGETVLRYWVGCGAQTSASGKPIFCNRREQNTPTNV